MANVQLRTQTDDDSQRPVIYLAGPNTPMGGGMFRIAEYLMQSRIETSGRPVLRLLETRGQGSALRSFLVLLRALGSVVAGKLAGTLAGVHVNAAERLSIVRKGLLMALCRAIRVPVVLHLHAAQLHRTYHGLPAIGKAAIRWVFSLPSCCIVLGREAADFVTRDLRVPPHRVEIVANGVPEPRVRRRARAAGSVFHVLFTGNLSERKGVSDLLRALAHPTLADVPLRLTLAGGGDVASYVQRAAELGVGDRTQFLGWTDKARVDELLAEADVLVLPSYHEGLPLSILEALALGVAVVSTPVGEIPHVLTDRKDALLVPPGDPGALAAAIREVLVDPQMRARVGRAGRALYEAEFSLPRFASSIQRIHDRHFEPAGARA